MGGGSIVVSGQGTELIVASCKFKNNQAGYAGGAIVVQNNAIAFIESSHRYLGILIFYSYTVPAHFGF